jgi:phosphate starvation-inducible PhoH-like protein
VEAQEVVSGIEGIAIVHFDKTDVVRHPLVQRIVVAYDERAARMKDARGGGGTNGGGNGGGDERS